ncbi:MAG: DNA repair protein RecO, partial [Ruminiclostridium sp.]|nr:DNA repair protein RecO [Ruminiclostridium sp.]
MLVTVEGIVIGRRSIGENGCFIDVLTDEFGVIEASAHGVKKLTSKNAGSTQLFSYAKFCFAKTGVRYTLNSAEPIFSFHGISSEIDHLSLAAYFADVIKDSSASEQEAKGFLRFMAITLYELDKMRIPPELIKSVFELHISAMLGFSPDLRACRSCACYEHKEMYFDQENACIVCGDCAGSYNEHREALVRISPSLLYAM